MDAICAIDTWLEYKRYNTVRESELGNSKLFIQQQPNFVFIFESIIISVER